MPRREFSLLFYYYVHCQISEIFVYPQILIGQSNTASANIVFAKLLCTSIYFFFEEIFFQLMELNEQYTILKYLILELRIDISSFYVAIGICSRDNLECNFTPIHKGNCISFVCLHLLQEV